MPISNLSEKMLKKVATGGKKKGLLGEEKEVAKKVKGWEQTGYSDSWIDGERLASDIFRAVAQLNNERFEVVTVTPITSGKYDFSYYHSGAGHNDDSGYGYGYGYSVSDPQTTSENVQPNAIA